MENTLKNNQQSERLKRRISRRHKFWRSVFQCL